MARVRHPGNMGVPPPSLRACRNFLPDQILVRLDPKLDKPIPVRHLEQPFLVRFCRSGNIDRPPPFVHPMVAVGEGCLD